MWKTLERRMFIGEKFCDDGEIPLLLFITVCNEEDEDSLHLLSQLTVKAYFLDINTSDTSL